MPKAKSSKPSASAPQAAPQVAVSWPVFKPPLPVVQLYPELHPATSNIVLVSSFFPRSLCRDYVAYLRTLPLQTTPSRPKKGEAVRVNDRFQIDDPGLARRLWDTTGLKELILEDESIKSLWWVIIYTPKTRQGIDKLTHLHNHIGVANRSVSTPISAYTVTPKANILTATVRSYFMFNCIPLRNIN